MVDDVNDPQAAPEEIAGLRQKIARFEVREEAVRQFQSIASLPECLVSCSDALQRLVPFDRLSVVLLAWNRLRRWFRVRWISMKF